MMWSCACGNGQFSIYYTLYTWYIYELHIYEKAYIDLYTASYVFLYIETLKQ